MADMTHHEAAGPTPDTIIDHIRATYPDADIFRIPGATFCSLDPERHFPNFVTIVENDDHDQASDLTRRGLFRLNIGVDRATFERIAADAGPDPDTTAADTLFPHPVYAAQRWIAIVAPSRASWETAVIPLIRLAYDRLAAQRARHARSGTAPADPWADAGDGDES